MDEVLRQMESAAMAAYRKDVENNADMTSVAINKKLEQDNLAISSGSKKVWHEAKSKEGHIYYWNILTNESVWEAPKEGFVSITEQREEKLDETAKQMREVEKYKQKESLLRLRQQKQDEEEERARLAREMMKERRVKEDSPEPVYGPIIDPGKNDPYGRWQTVKESQPVDYQLPQQENYFEVPVVYEPEPVAKEFKEKTVESLGAEGSSTFKKRRIGTGTKRNVRQRVGDD